MALGDLETRKGRLPDTILLLERASAMVPRNPAPLFGMGALLFRSGRWAEARDAFLKVEKLGKFPLNKLYLGESFLRTGEAERGRAFLKEARKLDSTLPARIGK